MRQRHWEAYEDSVFRHYDHFGPPGTLHIVADINIEREAPQHNFNDINKESEGPLPGEVPSTEDFLPSDTTDIDTEMEGTPHIVASIDIEREVPQPDFTDINKESEGPLLGKVPPPEAGIFF
ncbi:uncharacterized protein A4U43_C06F16410 [Asparagus officinalis]|uniref:Uncharacterized protein n=1 Tax=Asparagus officinalis TaxID=4686 RepID=A0A5P1EMW5_ASPOF|nr:uncharacterized protein A4U43_C06F16410 [Asparagus officinalis]